MNTPFDEEITARVDEYPILPYKDIKTLQKLNGKLSKMKKPNLSNYRRKENGDRNMSNPETREEYGRDYINYEAYYSNLNDSLTDFDLTKSKSEESLNLASKLPEGE